MGRPLEIGLSLATGFILSTPPTRLQQQALVNNLEQDNLDPFRGGTSSTMGYDPWLQMEIITHHGNEYHKRVSII